MALMRDLKKVPKMVEMKVEKREQVLVEWMVGTKGWWLDEKKERKLAGRLAARRVVSMLVG